MQTQRLLIRNYEPRDLDDFYEIFSDPIVMEQCEPAYDREKAAHQLRFFIDRPIAYAVVETRSGKMIGHALFQQMPGEAEGIYEIGWIYNRSFWRRGYAYEASRALIDYGFSRLGLHKVVAETIDPVKSASLMQKLGMKPEGVFRLHTRDNGGKWADVYWYGVLKEDR
ncbi:MAG: GNAT family N-acetyltransferase [Eubacteriales bacterium]|nr:GNAT family N-acetyltransferase [Eubacteriales bacterium]